MRRAMESTYFEDVDLASLSSSDFNLDSSGNGEWASGADPPNAPSELAMFLSVDNFHHSQFDADLHAESVDECEVANNGTGRPMVTTTKVTDIQLRKAQLSRKRSFDASCVTNPPLKRKQAHKENSRRYRANVGTKFKELSDLVSILDGDGVKAQSKSKVLQVSIRLMREFKKQVTTLHLDLALSSRKNLLSWVDTIVKESNSLYDALCPFMNIICKKRMWKYAEVWMPAHVSSSAETVLKLKGALVSPTHGNTATCIELFNEMSEKFTFRAGVGLVGRVFTSTRAETMDNLSDTTVFVRAQMATRYNINSGFCVPVAVCGQCAAAVTFFDTEPRSGRDESVNLANSIANYIGIAYGARVAKAERVKTEERITDATQGVLTGAWGDS